MLSGCDFALSTVPETEAQGDEETPANSQEPQQPVRSVATASPAADDPTKIKSLYEKVKRLNAMCVSAGGGVSGSPDCDLAVEVEEQLDGLGYCIDYANDEALIMCSLRLQGS